MTLAPTSLKAVLLAGILSAAGAGCGGCQKPPEAGSPDAGVSDAGTDKDAGGETPDAGDGCLALELGAQNFQANLFGQLTGVRYDVSPGIDEALTDSLLVEFYDSSTPGLPALTPGTFDLGTAPNNDLQTCQHCVWLPIDWDTVSPLSRVFVAAGGSLTLTQVEDPLTEVFAGSVSGLLLREATVDETGKATLVANGRCAHVPDFSFDTSPTPGRSCLSAEDCGNPLLEVCSPATNTCTPPECGDFNGCPAERPVCLTQYGTQLNGACYANCDPAAAASTCAPGQACVQLGVNPSVGVCRTVGAGALGATCESEDNSTTCAAGLTCSSEENACTQTCEYFASAPGCQTGHACSLFGVCEPPSAADPAGVGAPCAATATLAQGCALSHGAYRGICFGFDPQEPLVCEEACFESQGCATGEFCALRFSSGLGICLPNPVCGDGVLGEINETCDDGNTSSNDGCSGDCQTVEYDQICPNAPLLTNGATTGDTATAWDGFQATCQLGIARADVYRFSPTGRGRLRLTVDGPKPQVLSLRTTCADDTSEVACGAADLSGQGELIYQVTSPADLTVLVSAYTVLEQGPYTLHTEFTPENCGDGIVAGLEVCDDGNTNANDGCSADCSAVEYAFYCGQASSLASSATGDNTAGPMVFTASCANTLFGSGPDRLYTWTAPSTGTARFRLEPDSSNWVDLVLAVFDSCGAPASMSELGCSSVYDIEQVDVPVTAGQTLTVLVEGFNQSAAGPYTLTAQMLP